MMPINEQSVKMQKITYSITNEMHSLFTHVAKFVEVSHLVLLMLGIIMFFFLSSHYMGI